MTDLETWAVVWYCPRTYHRGEMSFGSKQDAADFTTLFHTGVDVFYYKDSDT